MKNNNILKLFIHFLHHYDLQVNNETLNFLLKRDNPCFTAQIFNTWLRYYDFSTMPPHNENFDSITRRIYDLMWMRYIVENGSCFNIEDNAIKNVKLNYLCKYLNEYASQQNFPIKNMEMLKSIKTRVDIEKLLK